MEKSLNRKDGTLRGVGLNYSTDGDEWELNKSVVGWDVLGNKFVVGFDMGSYIIEVVFTRAALERMVDAIDNGQQGLN